MTDIGPFFGDDAGIPDQRIPDPLERIPNPLEQQPGVFLFGEDEPIAVEEDQSVAPSPDVTTSLSTVTENREGRSLSVYSDNAPEKNPTIGVGFNLNRTGNPARLAALGYDVGAVLAGTQDITDAHASQLHQEDVATAIADARKIIPSFDTLSLERQIALADMSLNLGGPGLAKFTDMRKALAAGDFNAAADAILDSKYARIDVPGRAKLNADVVRGVPEDTSSLFGLIPSASAAELQVLAKTPAEQANEAQKLAAETGIPAEVVQRNMPEVKQAATLNKFLRSGSAVTISLSDLSTMAIAHDDLENLNAFERIADGYVRGGLTRRQGLLGTQLRDNPNRTVETQAELDAIRARIEGLGESGEGVVSFIAESAEILGQLVSSFGDPEAAKRVGIGGLVGAGAGLAGGPLAPITIPAGTIAGLGAGLITHVLIDSFEVEGGLAFTEMIDIGIEREAAAPLSMVVGAINAGLELSGATLVAAPFAKAGRKFVKRGLREALQRPAVRAAVLEFGRAYAIAFSGEVGTEVIQEGVNIFAEEIGKALSEGDFEAITGDEIADRLSTILIKVSKGMLLLSLPGPTANLAVNYSKARSSKKQMDELNKLAKESKLKERSPEKAAAFHADAMSGTLKVDATALLEFAKEHEDNTDAVLIALGIPDGDLSEALEAGGFVNITPEAWATNIVGAPGYEALANDMALSEQQTVHEATVPLAEAAAEMQEVLDTMVDLPANLASRMEEVLAAAGKGEETTAAEAVKKMAVELDKAPQDVMTLLDTLAAEVTGERVTVATEIREGRINELDQVIADLDRRIEEKADEIVLAEEEGRGTITRGKALAKLEEQRQVADDEQADLLLSRDITQETVLGATSDILRPAVPTEVVAENEALNVELENLRIQKVAEDEALERAETEEDKTVISRVKERRTAINKQITETEEQIAANEKKFAPKPAARERKVSLKAKVLDQLEVKTTTAAIRALRKGFRAGIKVTKENIKKFQKEAEQAITKSALNDTNKKNLLKQVRQIGDGPAAVTRLAKLKTRALVVMEKQRRQELRAAIKKVLKRTKPKKAGARPVGKFGPGDIAADAQTVLDDARNILLNEKITKEVAQERLDVALQEEAPSIDAAFNNTLLAIRAEADAVATSDLEQMLLSLESIETEGKVGGKLKSLDRRRRVESDKQEFIDASNTDAFGEDVDPSLSETTGLARRIQRRYQETKTIFGSGYNGFDDILDIILNKKGVDAGQLIERLRVTNEIQKVKARYIKWHRQILDIGLDVFNLKTEAQLLDKYFEDNKRTVAGGSGKVWTDQNNRKRSLEYSISEIRKLWMEWQDPTLKETIHSTNPDLEPGQIRGNAFTQPMLDALFGQLNEADKQYAQAQLDFIRSIYPDVNRVYRTLFGINLPFNEFYSQIQRDLGSAPEAAETGGLGVDTLATEQTYRRQLPTQLKSRTGAVFPLLRRSDIGSLQRYLHDMAWFIEMSEKVAHDRAVMSDPKVKKAVEFFHGTAMNSQIEGFLQDFGTGYPARGVIAEKAFNWFNRRFAPAMLGFKTTIGIKQLTSFWAMGENIPTSVFFPVAFKMLTNPKFAKKMVKKMYASSPTMQERDASVDRAVAEIGSTADPIFRSNFLRKTSVSLDVAGFAAIKLGDRLPIYVGGAAIYTHAIMPVSEGGLGQTHTQAIQTFEDAVNSTQQSKDIDKLSAVQRSGAIGRTLTMFMTARFSLLRQETRMWRQFSRGKITPREFGKRLAYVHILGPGMIQYISNGFRWDDDDQLTAFILGQFNALWLIGETLTYGVTRIFTDGDGFSGPQGVIPLMDTIHDVLRGVADAIDAQSAEELMEAMTDMLDVSGIFIGKNVKQLREITEATIGVLDGSVSQAQLLEAIGLSEKVAEEAAETELFSFESFSN